MNTVSMRKETEYYTFAEEIERIMTNWETTEQFGIAHTKWSKEKGKESGLTATVTAHSVGQPRFKVDTDGDTVMAPTRIGGNRQKQQGTQKNGNQLRAK